MKKIKERISDVLEIPKDAILDLPQLVLSGNREITIDNYKGIVLYSDTVMKINAKDHIIQISGSSLDIAHIGNNDISVAGFIEKIEFM
ncbi:MAG: sporulation protein YqfC [Oscillospiraceae bacterium]|nr:sporulation protein YqfC [Oscillospiraceae bacterium]